MVLHRANYHISRMTDNCSLAKFSLFPKSPTGQWNSIVDEVARVTHTTHHKYTKDGDVTITIFFNNTAKICRYNHSVWCTGPLAQSIGRPNTARQLSDHQLVKLHSARTLLLLQTAAGTRRMSVGPVRPVSSADA